MQCLTIRRKQKKGFHVEAFIKREVSKSRRELFLILHKTHYVCLLAHLSQWIASSQIHC